MSGSPGFDTTRWSLILEAAKTDSPAGRVALEALCQQYWYPLYAYARRRGLAPVDATDATQAFFAHLLERRALLQADRERGRFRTFLLTAFQNFRANEREKELAGKRGGGVRHISIDMEVGEERYRFEPIDTWTPERIFERRWALTLLDQVLEELRVESHAAGKELLFELCKCTFSGGTPDYAEAAVQLEMTEATVRVASHRLRSRYRELLKEHVARTLGNDDPAAVDEELQELRKSLRDL